MEKSKRLARLTLGVVIVVVLAVLLPVGNYLAGPPTSDKLRGVAGNEETFASAVEVLEANCAHCHTSDAGLPFYAILPVANGMIKQDVARGLRYFDLASDLRPFDGAPSQAALAKLERVVWTESMPPARYRALHWNAGLTSGEKQTLLTWIRESREQYFEFPDTPETAKGNVVVPLPTGVTEDPAKVALGTDLYHDTRLSGDETISCASCHALDKGGTDQAPVATGVGGAKGPINSPTVYNAVFNIKQFWDGRAEDLQDQAAGPVTNPKEMAATWEQVVERLNADAALKARFEAVYPEGFSKDTITDAIATFEKTLVTPNSRFDKYLAGDESALSEVEKKGWGLFQELGCVTCHAGPALGGGSFELMGREGDYFADRGNPTEADNGRFSVTQSERDRHRFKVPVLRNIALTFPYFHDASAPDLETAVRTMAKYQHGVELAPLQVTQLVDFLKSLTGEYQGEPL